MNGSMVMMMILNWVSVSLSDSELLSVSCQPVVNSIHSKETSPPSYTPSLLPPQVHIIGVYNLNKLSLRTFLLARAI